MEAAGAAAMVLILIAVYGVLFLILAADYVLRAWALYSISKRRQISNPWMAWVPFLINWNIGSLADDYDALRGIKRRWRTVLLTLAIITVASVVIAYVFLFAGMFGFIAQIEYGEPEPIAIIGFFLSLFVPLMLVSAVSMAHQICLCICYYKLLESLDPQKTLLYFLRGIFLPLAMGICLLRCRNMGYWRAPVCLAAPPVTAAAAQLSTVNEETVQENESAQSKE